MTTEQQIDRALAYFTDEDHSCSYELLNGTGGVLISAPHAMLHLGAKLGHALLYLLMIGMPIAGWLIVSAEGHSVMFYGMELPPLIGENKA